MTSDLHDTRESNDGIDLDGINQISNLVIEGETDYSSLFYTNLEQKLRDEFYPYDYLRPVHPTTPITWDDLEPFEHHDKALLADPTNNYKNLFRSAVSVKHLTSKIGTEVVGVNLADLDDVQRNELALLIARRVVVFFRHQTEVDPYKLLDLGRYYGRLHKHPNGPLVKAYQHDLEEVLPIWSCGFKDPYERIAPEKLWHSDISFEAQPPCYTFLKMLQATNSGGDTLWTSGYAIYDMLSPGLQQYLENLAASHSSFEQAQESLRNNNKPRRPPIETVHPVIRTHPVTGWKSVYVNPTFTKSIVGVPKTESDAILAYLFSLITSTHEAMVRFRWETDDIAIWDNRASIHFGSFGYFPERRHAIRVTPQAEAPYFDPKGTSQQAEIDKRIQQQIGQNDTN